MNRHRSTPEQRGSREAAATARVTGDLEEPIARLRSEEERARRSRLGAWLGAWWLGPGTPAGASWKSYAGMLLVVAASTAVAGVMDPHFEPSNLTMVYLLGVVVSAIAFGRGPAIAAAILSVAVFNFAFVPPRRTFQVADTRYLVTFAVMLVVAGVTGTLTGRLREQLRNARRRERWTGSLYGLSHELAARSTIDDVLGAAVRHIGDVLDSRVAILLARDGGRLEHVAGDAGLLDAREALAAARQSYENVQPVGLAGSAADAGLLHMPLAAGVSVLGTLTLAPREALAFRDPERLALLRALVSQTALAMERCRLSDEAQEARMLAETERTRSALLSSVSHDLRTPLAAITGAASSLREHGALLSEATQRELVETVSEEAHRLNRLIGNLLDMTRLESGTLEVRKEWHSIEEVIGAALGRLEETLGSRPVDVSLPADLPLVPLDDVLFGQVVYNLIENAHKYSPGGRSIDIAAAVEGSQLRVDVMDGGPGLAPGEAGRVFEKFYRGAHGSGRPGAGLGLAICRAILAAHGGTIEAGNRPSGGAVFTIRLPLGGEPPGIPAEIPDEAGTRTAP